MEKSSKFTTIVGIGLMLAVVFGLAFYLINIISYFDPFSWCHIQIHGDIVSGNEMTIHQALKLIKVKDKNAYKLVCDYVGVIAEKTYCKAGDARVDASLPNAGYIEPPCYIRGSKTIYLRSMEDRSEEAVRRRAIDIVTYADKSRNFWQDYEARASFFQVSNSK